MLGLDEGVLQGINLTLLHGWLLWVGWGFLGLVQFMSTRYFKMYWKAYMWIHGITGTLILLITIAMGVVGIMNMEGEISAEDAHCIIGLIMLFVTLFIAGGGMLARTLT